ncbi:sugar phosphate isomerase/epimerase family protein [Dictyobacter arantiisoli]|uniref:Xylose isomerase n=1 Tax=Dictyobacter arantiisoli TaxID=2014874 RepID=A0A5A5T961_9CHLR|nr:sugar phosphate isomerase/epimerase [Dictyobacter arantiisoli]GCF07573.1 xylose isomerase [Dictyobacter arantiisoli]
MIHLSAFADEISPDLNEQIAVLHSENIHYIDLRSVWKVNVLDFSDQQIEDIKRTLKEARIGVAAIGSPIGKVPIDSSFEEQLHRFERALKIAQALSAPYIRIFSFYPPIQDEAGSSNPAAYRDEVLSNLREMTRLARAAGIILIHENEKAIYGDSIERNVDLLKSINDPHFRAVLDPANYLQCDQVPYPGAYEAIAPWLEYVHVKDVRTDGTMAVAGDGAASWSAILERLRRDGYAGFVALEPHLQSAGQYQGFSGPELFHQASRALQDLLRAMGWSYA